MKALHYSYKHRKFFKFLFVLCRPICLILYRMKKKKVIGGFNDVI